MRSSVQPILLVLLAAIFGAGCGSEAGVAVVQGREYGLAVVRDIEVAESDISPYARIERANDRARLADDQAYALHHVDPLTFLLVRAKPGVEDQLGPWGPFIGLLGEGQDPDLCRYFDQGAPTWCG
jgi:hypothetical protein